MTVGGAVEHWLENRRTEVKASTWKTYRQIIGWADVAAQKAGLKRHRFRRIGSLVMCA